METPEFFQGNAGCYHTGTQQFTPEKQQSELKADHFIIDDLLDFPTDDVGVDGGAYGDTLADVVAGTTSMDSSTATTAVDSCNSSSLCGGTEPSLSLAGDMGCRSFSDTQFSNLSVPYDDLAELEWLSNFVEESFSNDDLQKLQLISGVKARPKHAFETHHFEPEGVGVNRINNPIFSADMTVPGKARTKRSRAAPCNWTSRILVLSPTITGSTATMSSESESDIASSLTGRKTMKASAKKKEIQDNTSRSEDGRKCLHCATDKTPQWRTGPMGPKTLCNACGVRYKSGRLVPEYRPAASPTFVLTKHSNSHRKVLELRRQKEMQRAQHHQQQFLHHQNIIFDIPNGDDYLIHQHISPDYRQLI